MDEQRVVSFVECKPVRFLFLDGIRDASVNGADLHMPLKAVMVQFIDDTVATWGFN